MRLSRQKHVARVFRTVILLFTAASAIFAQSESWRREPPKPGPVRPLSLPQLRRVTLSNGIRLILVEDHRVPVTTIQAAIPLAIKPDNDVNRLTTKLTLAEATAELLTAGARTRNSEELAREVESLGGRLAAADSDDFLEVSAVVISENTGNMLQLFADVLLHPSFPEDEVALYKSNRLEKLVAQRQDPAFLADERFDRAVFGNLAYAISAPTKQAVAFVNRARVQRFYSDNIGPEGAVLVAIGDFDAPSTEKRIKQLFEPWRKPARASLRVRVAPPARVARKIYLVNRAGSEQADLRVGEVAITRKDPDYFPLLIADAILGGGTSSRLFLNIRERLGYAYDVSSSLHSRKYAGAFYAASQSRTEVAVQALKEMLLELDRLRNELVSAAELQAAKNYLNGLFSLSLASQEGLADRLTQAEILELGPNDLATRRAQIDGVTAEQVRAAVRKHVPSGRETIVVIGDAMKLQKSLAPIGAITLLDTRGRLLRNRGNR